jgi:hypothetical protein
VQPRDRRVRRALDKVDLSRCRCPTVSSASPSRAGSAPRLVTSAAVQSGCVCACERARAPVRVRACGWCECCVHVFAQVCARMCVRASERGCVRVCACCSACLRVRVHAYVRGWMWVRVQVCARACACAYARVRACACVHMTAHMCLWAWACAVRHACGVGERAGGREGGRIACSCTEEGWLRMSAA